MKLFSKIMFCLCLSLALAGCDVVMNTQVGDEVGFSRFYSSRESTQSELVKRPDGLWDLKNNSRTLGQLKASTPGVGVISFEVVKVTDTKLWVGRKFDLVTFHPTSTGYTCSQCAAAGPSERTYLPPDWTAEQ